MRPRVSRVVVSAALALALAAWTVPLGAVRQLPGTAAFNLTEVLNRYEQNRAPDPDELASLIPMTLDGRLLASFEQSAGEWLRANGPTGIDRRRLTLAAFVLDVVSAERDRTATVSAPLIEWACERLREMPEPWPAERAWQIATVGLLENSPIQTDLAEHLSHARARFKNEPWFLLADAWAQQRGIRANPLKGASTGPYPVFNIMSFPSGSNGGAYPQRIATEWFNIGMDVADPGFTGRIVVDDPHHDALAGAGFAPHWPVVPSPAAANLKKARDDYQRAMDTPALAAEAVLRLAYLDLAYGKADDAVYHATIGLARAAGPDLEYVGHVLLGRARERQHRWDDAEAAYRAALVAVPDARTAANALAQLLKARGAESDAAAILARLTGSSPPDPWQVFEKGDLVPYVTLIDQLRKALL
jgi:tetratricopeptide (TPR) repeat protein